MNSTGLDASALLAYLYDETGAEIVESALVQSVYIGAINWAEVLSKISDKGQEPEALVIALTQQGILNKGLSILPTTEADALLMAQLRPITKSIGLSIGDRACLALAIRLHLPVLTSERAWSVLELNIDITMIRQWLSGNYYLCLIYSKID